ISHPNADGIAPWAIINLPFRTAEQILAHMSPGGLRRMVKTNELVVNALVERGITHAFTLPGLGITWSLPAFKAQEKKINVVLARSECIASLMAQTAGRLLRRPSVLMGQGPWITTIGGMGILEAHFSGSPMVVLTE